MRFIYPAFNHSTLAPCQIDCVFFGTEWLWNNKSSEKVNKHMRGRKQCLERDFPFCFVARLTKTKEKILHERNSNGSNKKNWISLLLRKTPYKRNHAAEANTWSTLKHSTLVLRNLTPNNDYKTALEEFFAENKSIYMMKRHRQRINRWEETFDSLRVF